jgi:predicted DNA-binding transcriptional regulator AlpA
VTAIPDFSAGGYRYEDLKRERIVSSRSDLHDKQKRYGFPKPIKTGLSSAWFPKSEVHAWLAERAALRDRPANPENEKRLAPRRSRRLRA